MKDATQKFQRYMARFQELGGYRAPPAALKALRDEALADPDLKSVRLDHRHPAHGKFNEALGALDFLIDAPVDTQGKPLPIDQREGYTAIDPQRLAAIDGIWATRAEMLVEGPEHPGLQKNHPDYARINGQMAGWYEALGEPSGVNDGATATARPAAPSTANANPVRDAAGGSAARDQAKADIARIRAEAGRDPKHPYNDRSNPSYAAMQKQMNELYAAAADPGQDTDDGGQTTSAAPSE